MHGILLTTSGALNNLSRNPSNRNEFYKAEIAVKTRQALEDLKIESREDAKILDERLKSPLFYNANGSSTYGNKTIDDGSGKDCGLSTGSGATRLTCAKDTEELGDSKLNISSRCGTHG